MKIDHSLLFYTLLKLESYICLPVLDIEETIKINNVFYTSAKHISNDLMNFYHNML
jgi:hypothetical protein